MNLKLLFITLCLIEAALVPTGCGQIISQTGDESQRSVSFDQLIDVGGYRLHLVCDGQAVNGSPTVILEAGGGGSTSHWKLVQPEVAKFARVCSYDRPGLGGSDRKPKPYASLDVMKDLHILLEKAKISKPYVMVGHSLGGMNIRLFAKLYPKEVVGMVFVDSFSEDEHSRTMAIVPPEVLKKYPPEYFKPMIREDMDFEASITQTLDNKWYGNIPLIVLTRAPLKQPREEMFPGGTEMFPGQAERLEKLRTDLQNDLARRSTNSKQIIAEKSGHDISRDQPELVVDSIRQVVEATRLKDRKRF
jgi:pimeloyl-ACP methyl ester carboxylesterase